MADKPKPKSKPKGKGGGGRTTALTALLAVVAIIAAWLSNCIPGFGIGSSGSADGEGEKAEKAEKAEPAEPEVKEEPPEPEVKEEPKPAAVQPPGPLEIIVDARGCILTGGEPQDCVAMCEQGDTFEGVKEVKLDTTEGPHDMVVALEDCLKAKDIEVSTTRE